MNRSAEADRMVCALAEEVWGDIAVAAGAVPVDLGDARLAFSGLEGIRSADRG